MPENEKKKKNRGSSVDIRDSAALYGDEADLPIRAPKKKAAKKKKPPKRVPTHGLRLKLSRIFVAKSEQTAEEGATDTTEAPRATLFSVFGIHFRALPVILTVFVVILTAAVFMNNSSLTTDEQEVTVVGLSSDLEDYKILVISDLNGRRFGDEQSLLLRQINSLTYNAVIFLGDMVGPDGDPEPFYELINGLSRSKPKFFICGDSDPGPFVETPRSITGTLNEIILEDWILETIDLGVTYVDRPTALTVGASTVWLVPANLLNLEAATQVNNWKEQVAAEEDGTLGGLQTDYDKLPVTTYRYRVATSTYNSIAEMNDSDLCFALSHEPVTDDFIYSASSHTSADGKYIIEPELYLSGHYCGGVWRLPYLGAFYIPDDSLPNYGWFPEQDRVAGLRNVGDTQVYITKGLSVNEDIALMPFRLFNQPEISVLTLTATLPENMLDAE